MSPQEIKEFCMTPKGKLLLICGVLLVFSWIFMIFQFTGDMGELFPTQEGNNKLKQELRKLRADVGERREKARANELLRKRYREQLSTYWIEERDGLVDTVLRNRVQAAAKELELTLNALGSVRTTRINQELYYAEVDNVSLIASYDVILKFLRRLSKEQPKIYWRRLDLRMIPVRQQRQQMGRNSGASTRSTVAGKEIPITPATLQMRFHGSLRVVGYDGKNPAALARGKKRQNDLPIREIPAVRKEKGTHSAGKPEGEVRGTPVKKTPGGAVASQVDKGQKGVVQK